MQNKIAKQDPRALAAFEDTIRNDPVRGLAADHFLAKLESHEPTNPEYRDRLVDHDWQMFLAGWNTRQGEVDELQLGIEFELRVKSRLEGEVVELKRDREMLNWLLGRLHIARQTPTQDIWQAVSFAAPQWDCAEKGQHDMRAIVAQAMAE